MHNAGKYLQQQRKRAKLSQEEVAAALGVVGRTVSDWETGKYVPSSDTAAILRDMIGADARVYDLLLLGKAETEAEARKLLGEDAVISPPPDVARAIEEWDQEDEAEFWEFIRRFVSWKPRVRSGPSRPQSTDE